MTAAGVRLGPGPITTGTGWRQSVKLDAAGEGSFEMPAADARAALVQRRRYARCYDVVNQRRTLIGEILIEKVERKIGSTGATMLAVSGGDLLMELADRTIGELGLYQDDVHHAQYAAMGNLLPLGDLVAAVDNDPATYQNIEMLPDWLWIGDDEAFDFVRWSLARASVGGQELAAEYWNGTTWSSLSLEDGTVSGEATLRRSGDMVFTPPGDWEMSTWNGRSAYWVRMQARDSQIGAYVRDLKVVKRNPTGDALARIMAFAPAGWSLDTVNGHGETGSPVLMTGAGESVLEMLIAVAEATGEHFRLGSGRSVVWLRRDLAASGVRAIRAGDGMSAEGNEAVCLVAGLTQTSEAAQIVNRVYPHGAADLTISNTSRTAANLPAGWTFSKTANWIENTVSVTALGARIERWWVQSQIRSASALQAQAASNALFDAAVEFLRLNGDSAVTYRVDVVRLLQALNVGQTLQVVYDEWVDDYQATAINDTFAVIGIDRNVGVDGVQIVGLEISSVGRRLMTGADMVLGALEQIRRLSLGESRLAAATTTQLSSGDTEAILTGVEVRDPVNRAIFRANRDDELVVIGPSTRQGWRYDASGHTAAPDRLTVGEAVGFFGTAAAGRPIVSGDRDGNAALQSLLDALAGMGLVKDETA